MADRSGRSSDVSRADEGGEIDLRALGRGIWRRKFWILGPTLLAALGAIAFVQLSAPYYRSSAMVLIENREGGAPRVGPPERETPLPDEQAIVSQVQLIQSRDLVRAVVAAAQLDQVPEFAESGWLEQMLRNVGLGGAKDQLSQAERVVDRVAENLSVFPVTGSRVIGVEFVSTDPDLAARTVNAFLDAYLDIQRGAKREVNKQASQYLSDEISSLRGRVSEAEEKVETFRAKAGLLVGTNNTTVVAQQLGDTSNQLSTARTQQAEAQAKSDVIRSVLKLGRPAEALEIANSELVRALAQQRSQLAAQIQSEARTLLPQHPRMRELQAQFDGLDRQIRSEAEKLARAFENDARTAGGRVAALTKQLDGLKGASASANNQDVQLRALEREARSQRDLLEQLLTRYRESTARENPDALLADARVIAKGSAATEPYFPKKTPIVLLVTLGAFVLSLFWAAAAEVFGGQPRGYAGGALPPPALPEDRRARLRGPDAADPAPRPAETPSAPVAPPAHAAAPAAATAAAVIAAAAASKATERDKTDAKAAEAEPAAADRAAEEVKAEPVAARRPQASQPAAIECADETLVAALARQLAATPIASGALRILATSASPTVSVAAVAAKLAATISEQGRRVVAVDGAGGAPGETEPGLSDLLSGDATFAQAIHRDQGSRVHFVPHGSERFGSLDPAAQGRLSVVLEALALTYDFVMITAPGGAGGADAFSPFCSAAVLVSTTSAEDAETVAVHDSLRAKGIDDVVVLLVPEGDGSPRGSSAVAA
ncbi:exopolysaccharide transport family protein [Methylopila sp. M107]|uniref:exopolysaccharide transport family protein n=1 Tax=Methylopila sp. M107 TaxID=1101190 RepID=UPI0003732698|nr:exopolysaccharide transport family protein [Methylopila sp. M107]